MIEHHGQERATGTRIVLIAASVVAWGVALVRAMPSFSSPDRGVFVSVAERLVAGDRLYVDVWDNKDPLFYYLLALGRLASPLMDYVIEVLWLVVAGLAGYVIGSRVGGRRSAVLVAGVLVPLTLTGGIYVPGYTYLPGTAVTLALLAALLSSRPALAGVLLGVLMFSKLLMLPVALALVLPWLLLPETRRRWRPFASGLGGTVAVLGLLLAARGELGGYLGAQASNVDYSQQRLGASGRNPLLDHLSRVVTWHEVVTIAAVLTLAGATAWTLSRQGRIRDTERGRLAIGAGLSLVAALVVVAATGLGPLHNQLLQVPALAAAVLGACFLAPLLARVGTALVAVLLSAVTAGLLAAVPLPSLYTSSASFFRGEVGVLLSVPPEARALLDIGDTGSYARLGSVYDSGSAKGLGEWDLACPRFHQYFFQSAEVLDDVLECVLQAPVVLVARSLAPVGRKVNAPAWNDFVTDAERRLAASYDCTSHDDFRVCRRRQ